MTETRELDDFNSRTNAVSSTAEHKPPSGRMALDVLSGKCNPCKPT
jgi:hypothetical protein